jgi:hypothetical protein
MAFGECLIIMLDIIFLGFSSFWVENGISINLGLNEKIEERAKNNRLQELRAKGKEMK